MTNTKEVLTYAGVTTAIAVIIGLSYPDPYKWQKREYLTGTLTNKLNSCDALVEELNANESTKAECTSTISVDTQEGNYVIGVLGKPRQDLEAGSKVRFLKQSSRHVTSFGLFGLLKQSSHYVTSFGLDRKGFLTADLIIVLGEELYKQITPHKKA